MTVSLLIKLSLIVHSISVLFIIIVPYCSQYITSTHRHCPLLFTVYLIIVPYCLQYISYTHHHCPILFTVYQLYPSSLSCYWVPLKPDYPPFHCHNHLHVPDSKSIQVPVNNIRIESYNDQKGIGTCRLIIIESLCGHYSFKFICCLLLSLTSISLFYLYECLSIPVNLLHMLFQRPQQVPPPPLLIKSSCSFEDDTYGDHSCHNQPLYTPRSLDGIVSKVLLSRQRRMVHVILLTTFFIDLGT